MLVKRPFSERRAGPDDEGRRLDRVLRIFLRGLPLSAIYHALRTGRILVNGRPADGACRVAKGDVISFDAALLPALSGTFGDPSPATQDKKETAAPGGDECIETALGSLLVLASADLLFLNKPRGMLVHGEDSLELRVREALSARSHDSLSFTPGPLHRLDRNSSGLVVFPRSAEGGRAFSVLLREHRVEKRYLALLEGRLEGRETWSDRLERDGELHLSRVDEAGTPALSEARPLIASEGLCLALVVIRTGLTHQIRVQASSRGHPLAGDRKYGGSPFPGGHILHALALLFREAPFDDLPPLVAAPLGADARRRLEGLFGASAMVKALETAIAT